MKRDRRLNPCDCILLGLDHHMRRQGYPGTSTCITLDAVGMLDSQTVAEALQRLFDAYPTVAGTAAVSFWRSWPVWRLPDQPVSPHYVFEDLSREADWDDAVERRCRRQFATGNDPTQPPLVRLEHYLGPDNRHRFVIRWPHALMDAEGAQLCLAEMDRLAADTPAPPPNGLLDSSATCDPLAGRGWLGRLKLVAATLRDRRPRIAIRDASVCENLPERPADSKRLCRLVRPWSPESAARVRDAARATTPPGPALYSRYLAACVLRACDRIHRESGRTLPCHVITLPLRGAGIERRTLDGNFLVTVTLRISQDRIGDRRAVAEDIHRQLGEFVERRLDLNSAALQWLMAKLRVAQFRRLLDHLTRTQSMTTGFSYFTEMDPPIRSFLGLRVTNLWGCGALSIPPGWNVTFSKFQDRFNLAIAWPEGAFPNAVVERYADLIEQEAFDA